MPPLLSGPTVTTQWLADHLGSDDLVILDATVLVVRGASGAPAHISGYDRYQLDGHLPGAIFADLLEVFSDPAARFPFTRPDPAAFERAAASVGVHGSSAVVVYDSAGASRLWWLFRSYGFETIAVLDGGLAAWLTEGRDTDAGHVEPGPGSVLARPQPGYWADKAEVERVVAGEASGALVCGMPSSEFAGTACVARRPGHIPGSTSVPASRLVDRGTRRFLSPTELLALYPRSVAEADRVIAYCAEGIASTATALSLVLAGRENVAVFDGSLNEWLADPAAPVTAG